MRAKTNLEELEVADAAIDGVGLETGQPDRRNRPGAAASHDCRFGVGLAHERLYSHVAQPRQQCDRDLQIPVEAANCTQQNKQAHQQASKNSKHLLRRALGVLAHTQAWNLAKASACRPLPTLRQKALFHTPGQGTWWQLITSSRA